MGVGAGATHFTFLTFLWRVLSALLGGVLIGAERQWRLRTAGLRTHALVTVGASLFMMVAPTVSTPEQYAHLAGQVITGIGFLGAGVLMRTGLTVHGLNTATTIWCSAAVGVLTGAGAYAEAYVGTFFVLVINIALVPLSNWFTQHSRATPHEHDVGYVLK
ncbi:MAG: MgtC/SapB family protein, partial [Verrucomicrobia bacterium]|nr:MgtC/SapB family protein [Verrucomicrobiota bacterium]